MGLKESVRKKLKVKVFDKIGSEATLYVKDSVSYDEYGSEINVITSTQTITIVPYNLIGGRLNYVAFGDLSEGDTDGVAPYDSPIALKSKITLNGVDYVVINLEDYIIDNDKIGIAFRMTKQH